MTTTAPEQAGRLHAELATARDHLARADTKASILLGLAGAGAGAGTSLIAGRHLPIAAAATGWAAVAATALAAVLLALAVRPTLRTGLGSWGVVRHGSVSPTQLATDLTQSDPEQIATELGHTAALALTKYRRVQRAVDLMLTGLALAAAATVLSAVL